jgi:hypothetical protein
MQNERSPSENAPAIINHGRGIWTITYHWRDAAYALVEFREKHPYLTITAMLHETGLSYKKITLITNEAVTPK